MRTGFRRVTKNSIIEVKKRLSVTMNIRSFFIEPVVYNVAVVIVATKKRMFMRWR
jgi:predicted GH43/DUF377 family glycosyl hydrolase